MLDSTQYSLFPSNVAVAAIPCLSLSKLLNNNEEEGQRLFSACKDRGLFFLDLQDHIEGKELLDSASTMFHLAERIFNLNANEKMKYAVDWRNTNGYKSAGNGKIDAHGTPDRCKFYTIGRDDSTDLASVPREQPSVVKEGKQTIKTFIQSSNSLVLHLFSILDHHLHLPPGTLAQKHCASKTSGSQMRMLRFEPQPDDDRRTCLVPHADLGSLTVLFNVLGGLQILRDLNKPETEDSWIYVRPAPGCAIVNVGDALFKWTNGLLKSPRHRVTYAPGDQAKLIRYSVVWFSRPDHKTLMHSLGGSDVMPPLKHGEIEDAITAEEWHYQHSKVHAAKGAGADD